MKTFVSKFTNYCIVLKHGIPREPITGREAIPGVYIRFEDGRVVVSNPDHIAMLEAHPAFGIDFIEHDSSTDPFSPNRRAAEPEHDVTALDHGQFGQNLNKRKDPQNPMDLAKSIATEMVKSLIPTLREELRKELVAKNEVIAAPAEATTLVAQEPLKKKAGRPKKVAEQPLEQTS